jgi:hypothetical protein
MLMRALSVHTAHGTAGAARIRHSLRPLFCGGCEEFQQSSGAMRRENAKVYLSFSVIPGRAQREPGIHCAAEFVEKWIPGLRQLAHPETTRAKFQCNDV